MHINKIKVSTNTETEIKTKCYRKAKVYGFVQFGQSTYFKTRTNEKRVSVVHRKEKARETA